MSYHLKRNRTPNGPTWRGRRGWGRVLRGVWCRRKAKSSNASAAVTSNDVEVGAEEGKRRGKTNILWKNATKSAHSIRAAHALRSVPFRCGQSSSQTTRWNGPPDRSGPHWRTVGWLHLRNVACSMQRSGGGGGMRCRLWLHFGLQIV